MLQPAYSPPISPNPPKSSNDDDRRRSDRYIAVVSDTVKVRLAEADDAETVAHLQQAMDRELGAAHEEGFIDRFAAAWRADFGRRPTWLAERDGKAIGVLVLIVVDNLPRPGQPPPALGAQLRCRKPPAKRDARLGRRQQREPSPAQREQELRQAVSENRLRSRS